MKRKASAMKKIERLARTTTPDGAVLELTARGGDFEVSLGGASLMSSREHHSEEEMARLALPAAATRPRRVLVGGLGMGYTLRAVLDLLTGDDEAVVVELLEAVVAWNRGPLAELAGRPLEDARARVVTADLLDYLSATRETFDAVLLDVDNGPEAFTTTGNARLYQAGGLAAARRCLARGGRLVVWSAFESPGFERTLARAGFSVTVQRTRSRGQKGSRHVLFCGTVAGARPRQGSKQR
jgi:spermidine synthase